MIGIGSRKPSPTQDQVATIEDARKPITSVARKDWPQESNIKHKATNVACVGKA